MHLEAWDHGAASSVEDLSETVSVDLYAEAELPVEKTLQVLVLEDDEADFLIAQKALLYLDSYRAKLEWVTNVSDAVMAAKKTQYDVVLVDFWLGMETGVAAIRALSDANPEVVIILLSGMPGEDVQTIALRAGAKHCINKSQLTSVLLEATIRSARHAIRQEKQLQQKIENLTKANEAKEQFYASMGHDLRTPLNAILGYSEMILGNSLGLHVPDEYQNFANRIHTGGLHLLEVVNNLMLQNGNALETIYKHMEKVDLGEVIEKSIDLVQFFASDKGSSIDLRRSPEKLYANCHRSLMTQALVNLLSNAIKYSPQDSQIIVSLKSEGETIVVSVCDNGVGMTAEDIELARKPYGRVQLPEEQAQDGSGLGLPIVEKIVSGHGGMVEIESEPGKGTCVSIHLHRQGG